MKKAAGELPAVKKHLYVVLDKIAEGIIEINSDGRINYANAAALSLVNIPEEHVFGSHLIEMFAGDDRQKVFKVLREAVEDPKAIPCESSLALNEHRVTLKFLFINRDEFTRFIILTDVTEKERFEEKIRLYDLELKLHNQTSQAFNSSLNLDHVLATVLEEVRRSMDAVGSSIWLTDEKTGDLICRQATGAYGETVRGWRLAPGEGLAGWVARHGKSLISQDSYTDERHYKEVDLTIGRDLHSVLTVPLRIKGDVIGAVQVVDMEAGRYQKVDLKLLETLAASAAIAIENARLYEKAQKEIAVRKKTEKALRESENRYRTVLEANPDSVIVYDMEGKVTYLNPTFTRVFGWKLEDRLGKKMDMFVPEEDWPDTQIMIEKLLAGEDITGIETHRYSKEGRIIPVSISGAIYKDRDGNSLGCVVNLRDITEQKKLEAQIHQAQKMEAIGTLAGGIAHDFNNLLMGIVGNVSLISLDFDSSHPYYKRLKNIEKHVRSGADLTKQLLGFAKGGKYEVKLVDINDLLERSSKMFSRTRKEIRIHKKYQKDIWAVEADPSQIEQVLLNLYVNAAQAMPGGGHLYLQTENVTLNENYVRHLNAKKGDYVKMSVKDTGVGMDENTIKRIFDPFFTTKDRSRGTGLGLASAYGIIKNHGGIINAHSIIEQGSTFDVYLPASTRKIIQKVEANREILKGSETILLIDDEEIIIDIGEQILKRLGYRALMARSGKKAIEIYQANKNKIDIVILDMIMPDMGGGETYDRLKKINPEIKVLLSSGYSIDGQASEIMNRGCNGFIQKPFNVEQLAMKIRGILSND
ncbi:MAG: PAS domain S-box protein [Desulfobacterales bacterium]|jgi:PAS domain S-box-containing protein